MELEFLGAAHEVTGSCHYLRYGDKSLIVDCGMEQGPDLYENQNIPVNAAVIDYVFITHAHIDHSGRVPMLIKQGFQGRILTTRLTADLLDVMLADSAHIQEADAEWKNRKAERSGATKVEPLYTVADAERVREFMTTCEYDREVEVVPGVKAVFTDAGHLLGSACITVTATEGDVTKTIVFSGDLGNINQPIIRDPVHLDSADYVVMESTYGDRNHKEVWSCPISWSSSTIPSAPSSSPW